MTVSFQRHHLAMLLKYSGISFVSGAVNHGFFSGERSLWTASAGVAMFIAGAWLEHRLAVDREERSLVHTLLWGTLLSIGLGFFTGGLQHFPDSPARSSWVVPLGFVLSVGALFMSEGATLGRAVAVYSAAGTTLVAAASLGVAHWMQQPYTPTPHSHGDAAGSPVAQVVSRSIDLTMDDTMRFTPSSIQAKPGETLRIIARNVGQVPHELVIGNAGDISEHAKAMQASALHLHSNPGAAITVAPGTSGELVVTFPEAARLEMACLVPGHYEAGMRGTVQIAAAETEPVAVPAHKHAH
jgi:uncharacterized cupredoxin-like copper-binding protein